MKDEIRQNGQVSGVYGVEYRDYLKHVAMEYMGFEPGRIEYFRDGRFFKS